MAAITSTTESWNSHKFSEVESHIKGSYLRDPWIDDTIDDSKTFRSFNNSSEVGIGLRKRDTGKMVFFGRYNEYAYICNNATGTIYFKFHNDGQFTADDNINGKGFKKSGSSSSYVLTGDGGHAAISGLSVNYAASAGSATDSTKLPLTGGTLTGKLTTKDVVVTAGSTISGRAFLVISSNSGNAADIVFANGHDGGANYGSWAISHRGESNSRFSIFRGAYNDANKSEAELFTILGSNGNVGIGTNSPSYKLHVSGDIYATGGITSASDERMKNVISNTNLTVKQIADAPTVKFTWKNNHEEGEQVGTLAQYWQSVLPEVVKDKSGELSLQYGVTALISSITTARRVVNHEERIKELEEEIKKLKSNK